MFTPALCLVLLASCACASSPALRTDHINRAVAVAPICGADIKRTASEPYTKRQISKANVQPRQYNDSSALLPIDVHFHILSADGTEQGGDIPDARINAQLQILDDAFRPVGFQFRLNETIRTTNERWYHGLKIVSAIEKEVVKLRKGNNSALNIYTMGALNTTTQAWGTSPSELECCAIYDGVTLNGTTFLGGSDPIFNLGHTLVHEVGHWFGLNHIFGNGCEQSYDYVDDTPIQDQPATLGGCDVGSDTCPDQPGLDLIHNYMSYSNDECRDSWTPGQIQRMREQMAKWRGVVYPGIVVADIPDDA